MTGATGFLGGLILDELLLAGHGVAALTRGGKRLAPRRGLVELNKDFTALKPGDPYFKGMDATIHAAAVVKMWSRDKGEFDRINVAGAVNFLNAAAESGVKKNLYLSSFIALGPADEGEPRREADDHPGPFRNDYERTKALACREVRALQAAGMPVQILYPGVMYGPGALTEGNLVVKIILDLVAKKVPGYIGEGKVQWSYTYAPAVAQTVAMLLRTPASSVNYVLGGDNQSTLDFYQLLPEILGHPIPHRSIPYWLGKTVGAWEVLKANVSGGPPKITPAVVEIYKHSWPLDSRRAEADLGYEIVSLREGLTLTVQWLKDQGKL
jgi:nucleoside-diphosphate-sugar epimerase